MKRDQVPFPYQLVRLLKKDGDHVSFGYPYQCGRQSHIIEHTQKLVEAALRCRRADDRKRELECIAEFISNAREIGEEIDRQWNAHVENLSTARRSRELEAA